MAELRYNSWSLRSWSLTPWKSSGNCLRSSWGDLGDRGDRGMTTGTVFFAFDSSSLSSLEVVFWALVICSCLDAILWRLWTFAGGDFEGKSGALLSCRGSNCLAAFLLRVGYGWQSLIMFSFSDFDSSEVWDFKGETWAFVFFPTDPIEQINYLVFF